MAEQREIIGVKHEGKQLERLVLNYIDSNHPCLKKIMIELPPGYELFNGDGWFSNMANHYKSKGVEVIAGDRKHWDVLGLSLEEVIDMLEHKPRRLLIRENIGICAGFFNGKLFKNRNQDMNVLFNQEKPEVTVVGSKHATYLKEQNPNIPFTYFTTGGLLNKLINGSTMKIAERVCIIDEFNPQKKSEYRKDLIKCSVSAGLVITSAVLDMPKIAQSIMAGLGTYAFLDNLEGASNYIRSLRK